MSAHDAERSARTIANDRIPDLVRMLNLIPYFQAHPGRTLFEAAADLGVSPRQMREDLERLHCCGPGMMPDELVDLSAEEPNVVIYESQGMDRPLRLTPTEAGALLLALESLEAVPGLVDASAVTSAADKLRALTGTSAAAVYDSLGSLATLGPAATVDAIRSAMEQGKRLHFTYHSPYATSATQREVSPVRMFTSDAKIYLSSYDHGALAPRTFLVEGIQDPVIGSERIASTRLREEAGFDLADPFELAGARTRATIAIDQNQLWLVEDLDIELDEEPEDGYYTGTLPVLNEEWLIQFVLANADRVKLVAPSRLVEAVRQRAKEGLGAYDRLKP